MTAVPERILKWLYERLTGEYHDPNRAYSDIAQTISQYPSLLPRTDVYTFESGASALLLVLQGTIPVSFRGTTYRFPIALWVPHAYPREPPMTYVTPTQGMRVRAGQYVSQEGRVYHPYLANWTNHWRVSSIIDFLSILSDIFAKEPPVASTQQQRQAQHDPNIRTKETPPPRPPPPEQPQQSASQTPVGSSVSQQPPARPPKTTASIRETTPSANVSHAGPPLPPKDGSTSTDWTERSGNGYISSSGKLGSPDGQRRTSRDGPPLPHLPPEARSAASDYRTDSRRLQQQQQHGVNTYSRDSWNSIHPHQPLSNQSISHHSSPLYPPESADRQRLDHHQAQPTFSPQNATSSQLRPQTQPPPRGQAIVTKQASEPVPDLLTSTFDIQLPTTVAPAAPPPIPPNPEKDALLQAVSTSLRSQLQQSLSQNAAVLPSLDAQHNAMLQALQNMQAEQSNLSQVSGLLSSNEGILRESMREADRVMEGVKTRALPGVDEVLVAPTIVAEQLYNLVAEERAIEDAMFALGRAVGAGRIGGDIFTKQTRSLAREQFLKKALIRKIAKGMNLNVDARTGAEGRMYAA